MQRGPELNHQSRTLVDKMQAAGVKRTLEVVEGGGHSGAPFLAGDRPQRLPDFLHKHLMPR
jgi:acetyl esterase/lipase